MTVMGGAPNNPSVAVGRLLRRRRHEKALTLREVSDHTAERGERILPRLLGWIGDLVGLDVRLKNLEYLHKTLGEKYRPCPLLVKYVQAGRLGRKTGRGFYDWSDRKNPKAIPFWPSPGKRRCLTGCRPCLQSTPPKTVRPSICRW